jgi:hypothetical protein
MTNKTPEELIREVRAIFSEDYDKTSYHWIVVELEAIAQKYGVDLSPDSGKMVEELDKDFGKVLDDTFSKEMMLEAAKSSCFMQSFKLAVWERMTNWDGSVKKEFDYIPEQTLDQLAIIAQRCLEDK